MEFGQLEKLLDFMAAHGLEEFEYEHAGLHIRLRKAPLASRRGAAPRSAAPPASPAQPAAPAAAAAPHAAEPAPAASSAQPRKSCTSSSRRSWERFTPRPAREAPPFVKVGDTIQAGQVVCIVEAMKLMNEIEADVSGEVVRALVENGQPVEYGQPLFAIRPAKKK